jgi:putative DNA primase/helicase
MPTPSEVLSPQKRSALEELQARRQWVCWRKEKRQGKFTKVPYAQAIQASKSGRYQGIGYMFHRDYTGIDLDHCVTADGSIDPWARAILSRLPSYTEVSPSGAGIHILVAGTIPSGIRRRVPNAPHPEAAVEMYCERRYFTITGKHLDGTPTTIEECPALHAIYQELTAPKDAQGRKHPNKPREQQEAPTEDGSTDDDALLDKAMAARNGATFRALWNGDTAGYASQSEAELALCHLLAFWTGRNAARMDHLFRRSGLHRDKWDRPARTGETYGQGTIARAIANCTEIYTPRPPGKIIPFRRERSAVHNAPDIPVPETDIDLVLDCLRDGEEGDARLYAHLFRGQCIYDHTEKLWYEWRGHSWQPDETKHALLMASNHLASQYMAASAALSEEAAQTEKQADLDLLKRSKADDPRLQRYEWLKATTSALIDRAKALKTLRRAQAVLTYAQAYLSITSHEWDTNPWLLGTPDGVLDLNIGELRAGRPEDYIRTIIPTSWKGLHEPSPRFEQYLHEIFADREDAEREELIAFLQRVLGYGITGNVNEHIFLMLYGEEGRNGKDTLMTRLQRVLGQAVGAVSNDVIIANTSKLLTPGAAKPHLCALQGRRIVWASETSKGARFDVGQVKFLTGGDIPARQLYGRDYTFAPSHLLILLTNHKPHADAQDSAFWDRLCPIIFNVRFVENPAQPNERQKDRSLGERLDTEASGILAWLVRGCLDWQRGGLRIPDAVLTARKDYRGEEDTLGHFLAECCVIHEQASVKASRLYERYKEWALENSLKAINGNAFGLEMKKRFRLKHRKDGNCYTGIGLNASLWDESLHLSEEQLSAESSSQADLLPLASNGGEGSEAISPKPPLYKGEKMQRETYKEVASPPSPVASLQAVQSASEADGAGENRFKESLHLKKEESASDGVSSPCSSSAEVVTRLHPQEWEEFIL